MLSVNIEARTIRADGVVGYDEEFGFDEVIFRDALESLGGDPVTLHLNSEGGVIESGMAIYNAIQDHGQVTVIVDAISHSISSVLMLAGQRIVGRATSSFVVHNPMTIAFGNAKEFRGIADVLDVMGRHIAELYAERTGGSVDQWLQYMDAETRFTGSRAFDAGLVDELISAQGKPENIARRNAEPVAVSGPRVPVGRAHLTQVLNRIRRAAT